MEFFTTEKAMKLFLWGMYAIVAAILIAGGMSVSGCAGHREYRQLTDQVGEYGVQAIEDKRNPVICYVYRDGDNSSLSCLPKVLKGK